MKELWEIVRADELKVGETFRFGAFTQPHSIESVRLINGRAVCVNELHRMDSRASVLRLIPALEDPRILRLALELAVNEIEARDRYGTSPNPKSDDFIQDARRELESEGSRER